MTDSSVIRKNIIWNVVGSMAFVGAQWLMTITIVRLSGYRDAGWLSLGLSLTNVATNIVYFGVRNFQVSDSKGTYSAENYIAQRLVLAAAALIFYTVFVLLNRYEKQLAVFLILFMVYRITEPIADVFHGIDQKFWRLDIAGQSLILRGALGTIAFVIVEKLTGNLILTTIVMILTVYPVLLIHDIPKACRLCGVTPGAVIREIGNIKELTIDCFPLFVYAISLNSIVPIPRYFLERAAGSELLGYYTSAAIPASIIQLLASYVYTTFTGLFSGYVKEGNASAFKRLMIKLSIAIGGLSALAAAGSILLGEWALCLLFTESIRPFAYLLVPTIGACFIIALVWFFGTLLTVLRDKVGLIAGALAGLVSIVPMSIIFIKTNGVDGVNIAVAAASLITLIIFAMRIKCGLDST